MVSKIWCCKDCDKRYVGCNAECETYKAQLDAHIQKKIEQTKAQKGELLAASVHYDGMAKIMNINRKKLKRKIGRR